MNSIFGYFFVIICWEINTSVSLLPFDQSRAVFRFLLCWKHNSCTSKGRTELKKQQRNICVLKVCFTDYLSQSTQGQCRGGGCRFKVGRQGKLGFILPEGCCAPYIQYNHILTFLISCCTHTQPHVTLGKHSQAPDRSVWSKDLIFLQSFVLWTTSGRSAHIYHYLRAGFTELKRLIFDRLTCKFSFFSCFRFFENAGMQEL